MTDSKKKKPVKKGFRGFSARFPNAKLPLTLSHGDQSMYAKKNKPLSPEMAFDFIWQEGDEDFSEFTEFVPCFRLPESSNYYAIIFWKGDMLNYQFYLAIFDMQGEIVEKLPIAGTKVEGELLALTEAKITTSWDIEIHSGSISIQETDLSKARLLPTSRITIDASLGKLTKH